MSSSDMKELNGRQGEQMGGWCLTKKIDLKNSRQVSMSSFDFGGLI